MNQHDDLLLVLISCISLLYRKRPMRVAHDSWGQLALHPDALRVLYIKGVFCSHLTWVDPLSKLVHSLRFGLLHYLLTISSWTAKEWLTRRTQEGIVRASIQFYDLTPSRSGGDGTKVSITVQHAVTYTGALSRLSPIAVCTERDVQRTWSPGPGVVSVDAPLKLLKSRSVERQIAG